MAATHDDLDHRRRRAAYRAAHRGTKEMDWLMGRYAEARLAAMSEEELERFERLLSLPDPELQLWILEARGDAGHELGDLVRALRAFHGLAPQI